MKDLPPHQGIHTLIHTYVIKKGPVMCPSFDRSESDSDTINTFLGDGSQTTEPAILVPAKTLFMSVRFHPLSFLVLFGALVCHSGSPCLYLLFSF